MTDEWSYGVPVNTDATNFEWSFGIPYVITEVSEDELELLDTIQIPLDFDYYVKTTAALQRSLDYWVKTTPAALERSLDYWVKTFTQATEPLDYEYTN
jgi:hypothetical protein